MRLRTFYTVAGGRDLGFAVNGYARANRHFSHAVQTLDVFKQAVGFAFISRHGDAARLGERKEREHDASID